MLFLLTMTSSLKAGPLSACVEEDICSAIVFNQLALSSIKDEIRGMFLAMNNTRDAEESVRKEHLNRCLSRTQLLEDQVSSLEKKYEQTMATDPSDELRLEVENLSKSKANLEDEKSELLLEVEGLRESKKDLEDENSRLVGVVAQQNERIQNLTIMIESPMDCADIQIQGQIDSGIYTIYPYQTEESIEVLCDMDSNGGGWTVFFNRQPQEEPLDFNEYWENFKNGFGDINTEFWLGNDLLHVLTSSQGTSYSLRVDAEDFSGNSRWAEWNVFSVGSEDTKYQLSLREYDSNSTMGDSFSQNSGSPFTTLDNDNDEHIVVNCALGSTYGGWGKGGWWYKGCGFARPTAPLKNSNYWDSASWLHWNPHGTNLTSLRIISMKLRRRNYEERVLMSEQLL